MLCLRGLVWNWWLIVAVVLKCAGVFIVGFNGRIVYIGNSSDGKYRSLFTFLMNKAMCYDRYYLTKACCYYSSVI